MLLVWERRIDHTLDSSQSRPRFKPVFSRAKTVLANAKVTEHRYDLDQGNHLLLGAGGYGKGTREMRTDQPDVIAEKVGDVGALSFRSAALGRY